MVFDFAFKSAQTTREIRKTIDYLAKQDLGYLFYDNWVQKVEGELLTGYKRAALAYSEGVLVGDIVWQPHKQFSRIREFKNLRISPKARGRYLAQFLVRQAECEDRLDVDAFIADARETQTDVINAMQGIGYSLVGKLNLYSEDKKDVILFKCADKNLQPQQLLIVKNHFGL